MTPELIAQINQAMQDNPKLTRADIVRQFDISPYKLRKLIVAKDIPLPYLLTREEQTARHKAGGSWAKIYDQV